MSKLKITYAVLIIVLGVITGLTIFRPISEVGQYSEVLKEQLVKSESEWIFQFNIVNREGESKNYTIDALVGNEKYTDVVNIPDRGTFIYIRHVSSESAGGGDVSFVFYKEDADTPFKSVTYYSESRAASY